MTKIAFSMWSGVRKVTKQANTATEKKVWLILKNFELIYSRVVSMGESAQLAPSGSFYVVSSAILSCKSFKIRVNFMMASLKIYKNIGLIIFF